MTQISRRRFLVISGASAVTLAACSSDAQRTAIGPRDPAVAARERALTAVGATRRSAAITAEPLQLDLAGRIFDTWGYRGETIRATAGQILEVALKNELPEDTTIHWHGISLRNDMDGVHDLTQRPIASGQTFTYRFVVPDPGTYFFHPHMGLQLDRALHAPLIIDDPSEPGAFDSEFVLVLDDWLESTPEDAFASLVRPANGGGMDHSRMDMGGSEVTDAAAAMPMGESALLGGHAGDVSYTAHLINGRPPEDRATFEVAAGDRVRLRVINAASDTAYRFAVGGHRLTVTHADGFPVKPVTVESLLLGMGERYDVVIDVNSGAHPIVASAEGKGQLAVAVLRAGSGEAPPTDFQPSELDGDLLRYSKLEPAAAVRLARASVDTELEVDLTGGESNYEWGINGKPFDDLAPFEIEQGQRVRVVLRNKSSMWHPMHLHGHSFALERGGARKDTVIVRPNETVGLLFDADNPGQWMLHCHNTYHLEAGMAAVVSYVR